jgi:tetratricopeptide (TPR) repeat protein
MGALVDLLLSYRAVSGFSEMIRLIEKMPRELADTVLVQEQLAFALNRLKQREQAEDVLLKLIERRGPSSETYSLLGRVYKDQWEEARSTGPAIRVRGLLDKAIEAYLKGFETDWRDAFPGINAVTLMELRDPPDPRRTSILPVVRYSVERRIAKGKPDYWDHATILELSVLAMDESQAMDALAHALAAVREPWEPQTTQRNLRLLREAREARGSVSPWMLEIEEALTSGI